jgi:hypothetical protein
MPTLEKVDLYKLHKAEYAAPRKPILLDVAPARYLAIAGTGHPDSAEFQAKAGALFATAYTMKFQCKSDGRDYAVCKFEAIYWTDQGGCGFARLPMSAWHWDLVIRVPEFVTLADLHATQKKLAAKNTPHAEELVFKTFKEGRCAQMLHIGPYTQETGTLNQMRALAEQNGLEFGDLHHEIYLNDPRRVEPAKLKTILRMGLRRAANGAR